MRNNHLLQSVILISVLCGPSFGQIGGLSPVEVPGRPSTTPPQGINATAPPPLNATAPPALNTTLNATAPPSLNVTTPPLNGTAAPPPLNGPAAPPPINATRPPASNTTDIWAQTVQNITALVQAGQPIITLGLPALTFAVTSTLILNYTGSTTPRSFALIGQGPGTVLDCGGVLPALAVIGPASVTLQNLTIQNCSVQPGSGLGGGAAYIEVGATITISSVTFQGNSALNRTTDEGVGGALYLSNLASTPLIPQKVLISNCVFSQNYARWGGGLVALDINADIRIDSCAFEDNAAEASGGAVYLEGVAQTTVITNTTFMSNSVTKFGGGSVYLTSSTGNVTISASVFMNSVANTTGGAIYSTQLLASGPVTISQCVFTSNLAQFGGAVYHDTAIGALTITGSSFIGNIATKSGGAVGFEQATAPVSLTGCTFTQNSAAMFGGAVDVFNVTSFTLAGGTFASNAANASGGGAIAVTSTLPTSMVIRDSSFKACSGGSTAGAIWLGDSNFTAATLSNNVFSSNVAGDVSGALLVLRTTGIVNITNSVFFNNQAPGNGGAVLFWNSTASFTVANSVFSSNSAKSCPNIQAYNSPLVTTSGLTFVPTDAQLPQCLPLNSTSAVGARAAVASRAIAKEPLPGSKRR